MNNLIGWCCMNCDQNFFLEKNDESNNMLGAINCPYCGTWEHTVMNTINKPDITPTVSGFMEDFDGEVVLADKRNFKDIQEFINQAESYLVETRGFKVSIKSPVLTEIIYNDEHDDLCWMDKKGAIQNDFKGHTLLVYKSDVDWDNAEG